MASVALRIARDLFGRALRDNLAAAVETSYTGRYLRPLLARHAVQAA